jgi:hypothetical protein
MTIIRILSLLCALLVSGAASAQQNRPTINYSATIVTGNTFQQILPVQNRWSLTIQNNNTSADNCWVTFGTTAAQVPITAVNATKAISIVLGPGQALTRYFPYVPSDAIIATCATTSDTLYVDIQ